MKALFLLVLTIGTLLTGRAEIQTINGQQYECKDGLCRLIAPAPTPTEEDVSTARLAQGRLSAEELIAFIEGKSAPSGESDLEKRSGGRLLVLVLLVLVGGLAMNLTPCVLPMVPVTLMVIGKSMRRGVAYGLGITLAYGALGAAAAAGGFAFGAIQGNAWFNLVVALVFAVLGLALLDVFFLDFSRWRRLRPDGRQKGAFGAVVFAFAMGSLSAVLAGACVAPILVAVLVLTARLFAGGAWGALALPFVLGLGMALPWPFIGAGLQVLPKPGAWMKWVNRLFALAVFALAVHYGVLSAQGFGLWGEDSAGNVDQTLTATPKTFPEALAQSRRPVFVDCWATWCRNCSAMEKVLSQPEVRQALRNHRLIRLQAEDIGELTRLKGFGNVRGLPAFLIFE